MQKKKILFGIITFIVLTSLFQPLIGGYFGFPQNSKQIAKASCTDECAYYGQSCPGGGVCGNYDSDSCLECPGSNQLPASGHITCSDITPTSIKVNYTYSNASGISLWKGSASLVSCASCDSGGGAYVDSGLSSNTSYTYYLRNGTSFSSTLLDSETCRTSTSAPSCTDDCSYYGQINKRCSGSYLQKRTCGNFDSDSCLDWSSWSNLQNCGTDSWTNNYKCSGNWVQREKNKKGCSNNQCYSYSQWKNYQDCQAEGKICQNGQCVASQPQYCTLDIYTYSENTFQLINANIYVDGQYKGREHLSTQVSPNSSHYVQGELSGYQSDSKSVSCTCGKTKRVNLYLKKLYPSLEVSCSASPNPVKINQSVTFTANASGGTGNYTYSWSGACISNFSTCTSSFSQAGTYLAAVTVTSGSQTKSASCSVQVNPLPCECSSWSDWQNRGCGQGGCSTNEMWQEKTRYCSPPGCSLESETRCIDYPSCQPNDLISGTLSSSCGSACLGDQITFTISAQDDQGVEKVCLKDNSQAENCQSCNWNTFCTKNWQVTKQTPGNYVFYGRLYGRKPDGSSESALTNPSSTTVEFKQCCTSHYKQACYDNDVYWYDSCNNREEKAQECGNSDWTNDYQCSGNWVQRKWTERGCSQASCFANSQWKNYQDCQAEGKICQNGQCVAYPSPTVDIKANNSDGPITISYNSSVNLTWSSTNANSCQASGSWSGTKSTAGSESFSNLTSPKTYTITCTGGGGSASDSVIVNVAVNHSPTANAGPDKEVYETESIVLEGSGSDPDGDSINYFWSCSGGSLSNPNIAQPLFYAPSVSQNINISCTLTVKDPYQASDSDSMNILVKVHESPSLSVALSAEPSSGCSPLNDVDLKATISGTATGSITYFFDCTGDGIWEKIETGSSNSYTAYNLCNYSSPGTYLARARVERQGLAAQDSTQINTYSCYSYPSPTVDIKANNSDGPITISYNSSVNLTWSSTNANSCQASGSWSGTKSTAGSESFSNLTSSKTYTITCTGEGGSAVDSVVVNVGAKPLPGTLTVDKWVRNLSDGTGFAKTVPADPSEVVSFQIRVRAQGSTLHNIIVKDTLPTQLIYRGNLKINGATSNKDIISGMNIGDLSAGQTKTITFRAQVANSSQFAFGKTKLINAVISYTTQTSDSDTATITVNKKAVAGAATAIPTGLTNNFFLDSFFLPLMFSLLIVWLFKSHILGFERWLDLRKKQYQEYHSQKLLQLKISKIKTRELFQKK